MIAAIPTTSFRGVKGENEALPSTSSPGLKPITETGDASIRAIIRALEFETK